jgi:hypothetical protein
MAENRVGGGYVPKRSVFGRDVVFAFKPPVISYSRLVKRMIKYEPVLPKDVQSQLVMSIFHTEHLCRIIPIALRNRQQKPIRSKHRGAGHGTDFTSMAILKWVQDRRTIEPLELSGGSNLPRPRRMKI